MQVRKTVVQPDQAEPGSSARTRVPSWIHLQHLRPPQMDKTRVKRPQLEAHTSRSPHLELENQNITRTS